MAAQHPSPAGSQPQAIPTSVTETAEGVITTSLTVTTTTRRWSDRDSDQYVDDDLLKDFLRGSDEFDPTNVKPRAIPDTLAAHEAAVNRLAIEILHQAFLSLLQQAYLDGVEELWSRHMKEHCLEPYVYSALEKLIQSRFRWDIDTSLAWGKYSDFSMMDLLENHHSGYKEIFEGLLKPSLGTKRIRKVYTRDRPDQKIKKIFENLVKPGPDEKRLEEAYKESNPGAKGEKDCLVVSDWKIRCLRRRIRELDDKRVARSRRWTEKKGEKLAFLERALGKLSEHVEQKKKELYPQEYGNDGNVSESIHGAAVTAKEEVVIPKLRRKAQFVR
ncbi:hypothetical protein BJ508DRAFT_349836 [Ascobolus immersus RN42]|uniref:Uncharacterized protein n=1 Tax=Ascobolus immersus RN42 TaxID=1160509 RepID=A0A3N4HY17_ASCIM|nr:hypothetical protein BJ508DRAFT_349836 [Ascobolus immersus RN42]